MAPAEVAPVQVAPVQVPPAQMPPAQVRSSLLQIPHGYRRTEHIHQLMENLQQQMDVLQRQAEEADKEEGRGAGQQEIGRARDQWAGRGREQGAGRGRGQAAGRGSRGPERKNREGKKRRSGMRRKWCLHTHTGTHIHLSRLHDLCNICCLLVNCNNLSPSAIGNHNIFNPGMIVEVLHLLLEQVKACLAKAQCFI
ncbi:uncharacterized protein LOC135165944 isoform X1 [Diachasmimorpha longicaudata]|uniref:uncharacterized protein LOC135165944 isoform X1 n=1 Tax=Diachasmimorpha longicaudata TaxID=58733 RepID=UPI0030B8FD6D